MKISKSKLTIFHEKAKLIFIQEQRYFDPMEKKKIFFSTQLRLSKLWSSWNEDAQKRAPLKTRSFFFIFSERSHPVARGGETCLAETGTFHRCTSDGFFDLITPLQVGAGRSLAKGRYLAAYRARCGACSFATANYEEEERG